MQRMYEPGPLVDENPGPLALARMAGVSAAHLLPSHCADIALDLEELRRTGRDDELQVCLGMVERLHPVLHYAILLSFLGLADGWVGAESLTDAARRASSSDGIATFLVWLEEQEPESRPALRVVG